MRRAMVGLVLLGGCAVLVLLLAPVPADAQCSHFSQTVVCPSGVPAGSGSVGFSPDGSTIFWSGPGGAFSSPAAGCCPLFGGSSIPGGPFFPSAPVGGIPGTGSSYLGGPLTRDPFPHFGPTMAVTQTVDLGGSAPDVPAPWGSRVERVPFIDPYLERVNVLIELSLLPFGIVLETVPTDVITQTLNVHTVTVPLDPGGARSITGGVGNFGSAFPVIGSPGTDLDIVIGSGGLPALGPPPPGTVPGTVLRVDPVTGGMGLNPVFIDVTGAPGGVLTGTVAPREPIAGGPQQPQGPQVAPQKPGDPLSGVVKTVRKLRQLERKKADLEKRIKDEKDRGKRREMRKELEKTEKDIEKEKKDLEFVPEDSKKAAEKRVDAEERQAAQDAARSTGAAVQESNSQTAPTPTPR